MSNSKIIFMGTPEIAEIILGGLIDKGYEIACVVTQPDRPKGRGKEMVSSPVKLLAEQRGIMVYQPERVKDPEAVDFIKKINPDLIIVAAFGQIIPKSLLEMPKYGCINVHASLLPKYRGASPIQWVLLNGEELTGVTIMHMAPSIDTGDIVLQREVMIDRKETFGSLHDKLAAAGITALCEAIPMLEAGTAPRRKQEESESSYYTVIEKSFGYIDFNRPAAEIERKLRALSPWPSAFTSLNGKTLKLWSADVVDELPGEKAFKGMSAGTIVEVRGDCFVIKTGKGYLKVTEVQLEGKRRMPADEFLRGCRLEAGQVLR